MVLNTSKFGKVLVPSDPSHRPRSLYCRGRVTSLLMRNNLHWNLPTKLTFDQHLNFWLKFGFWSIYSLANIRSSNGKQTHAPNIIIIFFSLGAWNILALCYLGNNNFGAWFSSPACDLPQWITPPLHSVGARQSWCPTSSWEAPPMLSSPPQVIRLPPVWNNSVFWLSHIKD